MSISFFVQIDIENRKMWKEKEKIERKLINIINNMIKKGIKRKCGKTKIIYI